MLLAKQGKSCELDFKGYLKKSCVVAAKKLDKLGALYTVNFVKTFKSKISLCDFKYSKVKTYFFLLLSSKR